DKQAETKIKESNEAIHEIDEGIYGISTRGVKDIPFDKLKAITTNVMSIDTEDDDTVQNDMAIEEQVFSTNINPDEVTDEEQVGYDAEDAWQEISRYGTSETASDFYGDQENYDEMYPNSDENVGYTEDIENFLGADAEGNFTGV